MIDDSMLSKNFNFAKQRVYIPCNFKITSPVADDESQEYGAGIFTLNDKRIITRTAKITPKKIGQFVAIWQRDEAGITQPQHIDGQFDLLIINCKAADHFGQFIFPKSALAKHNIISTATKRGKNGIRVYPPWDWPTNKQAIKTQNWQLNYFLEIDENTDLNRAKQLCSEQAA